MLLPDMGLAVDVVSDALEKKERILVHGDYDVDGVSACALLQRALTALGGEAHTHLPHRISEGYGLSKAAIENAASMGVTLLITADCGTGAAEEIARALSLGMRVVVTDHHQPDAHVSKKTHSSDVDSSEVAEVNPKRADSEYPFADLSGVGVAFKLIEALARRRGLPPQAHWRFLDLVALGTVADVCPLVGENRFLVKEGLQLIGNSRKVGISALTRATGLRPPISSRQVAFVLAPRLNAAGRLAHPKEALRLLTTGDEAEAERLAETLCEHNRARQAEESRTLKEALEMIDAEGLQEDRALLLAKEGWHPGVIGIVASRLVELFHRPVFLVAFPKDAAGGKPGTGSARTVKGFHLWEALHACRHLLFRFGGHEEAAGFSVLAEKIPLLRERLCELAEQRLSAEHLPPALEIDILASAASLTLPAVEELDRLEPFGAANSTPRIAVCDLKITEISRVGQDRDHLRLCLHEPDGPALRAIWFGKGGMAERLTVGERVDVCLSPRVTTWKNAKTVELRLQDVAVVEESG
jgi:single-stranded-DNA-specific exonuclease